MPPSHHVSRILLITLVFAVTLAGVVAVADPATWDQVNQQAQQLWTVLRTGLSG